MIANSGTSLNGGIMFSLNPTNSIRSISCQRGNMALVAIFMIALLAVLVEVGSSKLTLSSSQNMQQRLAGTRSTLTNNLTLAASLGGTFRASILNGDNPKLANCI